MHIIKISFFFVCNYFYYSFPVELLLQGGDCIELEKDYGNQVR